jgi:DNA-binding transcriptional LysR family regulator
MIELWTLRVLTEVADRGSFSAAAYALSMTQPAVSRQIAALERRVGVALFRRVPRGAQPTEAGEAAVELAREILARVRGLETKLNTYTKLATGRLRMSAFASANTFLVPEAIRRFTGTHPGIALKLVQPDPGGPLAAVREGRVDLALLTAWHLYADPGMAKLDLGAASLPGSVLDGIDVVPLLDEELHVALPSSHPLADNDCVWLRDLRDAAWIEGAFPDCLGPMRHLTEALGNAPRVNFVCDDWTGKQALVAADAGVMLVPATARAGLHRGVVLRPTSPVLPTRRLYAAVAAPPVRVPAVTAMLAVLTAVAAELRTPPTPPTLPTRFAAAASSRQA